MDPQLTNRESVPVPKMGHPSPPDSVLNVEVSCYPCYYITDKTPPPTIVNLLTFLISPKHKKKVEAIRGIEDKDQRNELKALLPAITPSGVFSANREDKGLLKHSGLLQFDIDLKGNEHIANYSQLKKQICHIPNVAYCGLSVSGKGFWGLIPIAYPEKHREHFKALKKAFARLGITIDAQCINVARLRGYSYDPDAYFNHQATAFYAFEQPEQVKRYTTGPSTDDSKTVEQYLAEIEKNRVDLTGGYGEWWEIGCSFATAFGENGRDYFHRVSQFHPDYSQKATDDKYDECLKGYRFNLGTFFYYCHQANIKVPIPREDWDKGRREPAREREIPCQELPARLNLLEFQSSDIVETRGHTQYGKDFGFLITDNYKLSNGKIIQVLYDQSGELITMHDKIQPLASYFKKSFIPGRLNGIVCLINVIENQN